MNLTPSAQSAVTLLGRTLVALLFIPSGLGKIAGFSSVAGFIALKGVPLPQVCAALAIAIEVGLGLLLLLGWRARWAAFGLAVFVVVITPIFHGFWAVPVDQMRVQQQLFFKNVAVIGGLLVLAVVGAGGWSLDAKARRAAASDLSPLNAAGA